MFFLIAWVLAQSFFAWSAFQAPRYIVDLDYAALSADLPKADQVAILVPIRQAFLNETPKGTLMIPRDDAAIQIRIATKDPQMLDSSQWTEWTIDQIADAYAPLEAFQRQLTLVILTKLEAQQSALWAKAAAMGEEAWTLSLNAASLQTIQNLQRRKETALLRLEALDKALLSLESPQEEVIIVTVKDRYPTLLALQAVILACGVIVARSLKSRFSA